MAESSQNHYQVLRIERTADERAIKKAYFTLIRQFPPDTAPEEFKRIREAYEVLSDPVARQRFDNADKDFAEYGEELSARLKAIDEVQKGGEEAEAQRMLKALLDEHPDLVIARENLGFSFFRTDAFKDALEQFSALAEQKPEEARYHLHQGLSLNRLGQQGEALRAVRKAHEVKPLDLGIHLALIDLLQAQGNLEAALREIYIASDNDDLKNEQALLLGVRKADAYLSLGALGDATDAVEQLKELIREMNDPELPQYVASKLAGAAARLFAKDQHDRANAALAKCTEIFPESTVYHPYRPVSEIDVETLPDAGFKWLSQQESGPTSPKITDGWSWGLPMVSLVASSAIVAAVLIVAFEDPKPWGAVEALGMALLLLGLAVWFGYSARATLAVLRNPLKAFTTIHPLFLLRVRGDRIRAYSLFHLTKLEATHHHTNGAYTHTAVSIWFGNELVNVSLHGRGFAEGWVQFLGKSRGRSLELMSEGYLEAEHGVELFPPALLAEKAPQKSDQRADSRRVLRGAALCAVAPVVTIVCHALAADSYAYRLAVRGQTIHAYNAYLEAYPSGRHVEEAKRRRSGILTRATDDFRAVATSDAPFAKAILTAVDALDQAGAIDVAVMVRPEVVDAAANATLSAPDGPFAETALRERGARLVERLGRTLDSAGLSEVMQLKLAEDDRGSGPVSMTIQPIIRPEGSMLQAEGVAVVPAIQVDWEVILSKTSAEQPLFRFTTSVGSPAELELARPVSLSSSGFATIALDAILDDAFNTFASRFATALGLPGVAREALPPSPKKKASRP